MAVDALAACTHAANQSGPSVFLVVLAAVFSIYILADSVIAAAVIRKKVLWPDA